MFPPRSEAQQHNRPDDDDDTMCMINEERQKAGSGQDRVLLSTGEYRAQWGQFMDK